MWLRICALKIGAAPQPLGTERLLACWDWDSPERIVWLRAPGAGLPIFGSTRPDPGWKRERQQRIEGTDIGLVHPTQVGQSLFHDTFLTQRHSNPPKGGI